jgi:hypothetical protein
MGMAKGVHIAIIMAMAREIILSIFKSISRAVSVSSNMGMNKGMYIAINTCIARAGIRKNITSFNRVYEAI